MSDLDRVGRPVSAYNAPQRAEPADNRGRLRVSMWQCFCLAWNRQSAEHCARCGRVKAEQRPVK